MNKISSSEITPYSNYINRRKFIKSASAVSLASSLAPSVNAFHLEDISAYNNILDEGDELNTFEEITTYNNFMNLEWVNQTHLITQKNLIRNHGQ